MSVPAAAAASDEFSAEDWMRALDARPDLLARLHAGDAAVMGEIFELNPNVTVLSVTVRDGDES